MVRESFSLSGTTLVEDAAAYYVSSRAFACRAGQGRNIFTVFVTPGPCLGGFLRLSGLQPNAIVGQNLALARAVYFRRITKRSALPLDIPLYLGGSLELGSTWLADESFDLGEQIYSGSLFFGMDTPLGPLYLAYGRSEAGEQSFNLFLGQVF